MKLLFFCTITITISLEASAFHNEGKITELIHQSVNEAKYLVDNAYTRTRTVLKSRLKREVANTGDIMAFFKQPVAGSRQAIRAADYMGVTLQLLEDNLKLIYPPPFNVSDVLTPVQKEILAKLTGCAYQNLPKVCNITPYRSINGECNNRFKPNLGASNTGYKRLIPPEYEDRIHLPRGWTESKLMNGFPLPLARDVSNQVVTGNAPSSVTLDPGRSHMFMHFGQFIDHDTDLSPDTPARSTFFEGIDCDTSCARQYPCFPISIPKNDPRITSQSDCLPMFRSAPVCNIVSPVREQINVLTSYVDGSQVYGSDMQTATKLRNTTNDLGLLAINQDYTDNGRPYLPFSGNSLDLCGSTNKSAGVPCFMAGDTRVNEQLGLMTLQTLFLREHNRLATKLHQLNPQWDGETLYQESRKIVGSMIQKITYGDWMPLLLGSEMSRVLPQYTSYNDQEDPRISNAFTIAFRMGHTMVHPVVPKLNEGYQPYQSDPTVPFHKTFFATWRMVKGGGTDPLVRGMVANPAKLNQQDHMMTEELRDHLFELTSRIGLDLASFNIQRGRDHGLAGYNTWRRYCGLSEPKTVDELATVLNNRDLAEKLMEMYGTADNIDLWVGGVSEPLVPGGRTGKLLASIIGEQFRATRDGDRFFYQNPSVFSPEQLASIEKMTLARLICDNTNITEVPLNVFLSNQYPLDFEPCSRIPEMDLSPWIESV